MVGAGFTSGMGSAGAGSVALAVVVGAVVCGL